MYKVYKYTNLLNGKIYIGQTCSSLEKRAGHNGYKYKKCIYFYNAIKKYGWNNFRGEILLDNLTREEANLMEIKLISFYNSNNKSIGYNISDGGNTNSVRRRSVYQYDLEGNYIQKFISATEAENKLGISSGRISSACLHSGTAGKYQWRYTKEKHIDKGYINGINKKVYQYDLNGNYLKCYDSLSKAGEQFSLDAFKHISDCCNNKRSVAYGYQWSFDKKDSIGSYRRISEKRKQVYQYSINYDELLSIYQSITEAGKQFNEHAFKHISSCCNGKQKTAYGYRWSYTPLHQESQNNDSLLLCSNL